MLNEFFKMIIEIIHVLLMIRSLQRKENTKKTTFEVHFGQRFLKTGLLDTGLYCPCTSSWMYVHEIIYSEPQQRSPLKSLYFRLNKYGINFSPALCNSVHSAEVTCHLRLQDWLLVVLAKDSSCFAT